jgi:hypothetical protein
VLALLDRCGQAYAQSTDVGRRDYNQAWFVGLDIDADDERRPQVTRTTRTPIIAALQDHRKPSRELADLIENEERRRAAGLNGAAHSSECLTNSQVVELRVPGFMR